MPPLRMLVLIVSLGSGCAFDASGTHVDPSVAPDAAVIEADAATIEIDAGTPDAKPNPDHGHGGGGGEGPGFD